MARAYDIAVAAVAIGVERKWLDNLTTQHSIPGTEHVARGVARRLSMRTLLTAAIVRDLNTGLGVPVARGVQVAESVLGGEPVGKTDLEGGSVMTRPAHVISEAVSLVVDVAKLETEIERQLIVAMETVVPRRRGRPPRKERRGTR